METHWTGGRGHSWAWRWPPPGLEEVWMSGLQCFPSSHTVVLHRVVMWQSCDMGNQSNRMYIPVLVSASQGGHWVSLCDFVGWFFVSLSDCRTQTCTAKEKVRGQLINSNSAHVGQLLDRLFHVLEPPVNDVDAVCCRVSNVLGYKAAKSREIGGDRRYAHHCTLSCGERKTSWDYWEWLCSDWPGV